jgi:hypothetical protein
MVGRVVKRQNVGFVSDLNNVKVDLSDFISGNYMLRLSFDDEPVSIEKLIVK